MPTREIDQADLDKFAAEKVFWWGGECVGVDLDSLLVFILAKNPTQEKEVREKFCLTDEDFYRALKNAPPGLFWGPFAEKRWETVNKRFGIDPPLPMPEIDWEARLSGTTKRKFL